MWFTEKHAFWRQICASSREKHLSGIVESKSSKFRFRFPTLEPSTRFPESILDALVLGGNPKNWPILGGESSDSGGRIGLKFSKGGEYFAKEYPSWRGGISIENFSGGGYPLDSFRLARVCNWWWWWWWWWWSQKKKSRNTGKKDQEMPLMMFTQSPMHGGLKHSGLKKSYQIPKFQGSK